MKKKRKKGKTQTQTLSAESKRILDLASVDACVVIEGTTPLKSHKE